jgi:hypothetical protein
MTLDARQRSSIYQSLVPLLGDDDANALMSEFPAIEADELVTKQFLRAEMAITRGELRAEMAQLGGDLRGEMAQLGGDLRGEMAELRTDLRGEMAELRTDMAKLENRVIGRMGAGMVAQTTLLIAAFGLLG